MKLHHTADQCNTLACCMGIFQRIYWNMIIVTLQRHTATHCNTLQHTATHCNTLQYTATKDTLFASRSVYTRIWSLQHCNTLQHTATFWHVFRISQRIYWNVIDIRRIIEKIGPRKRLSRSLCVNVRCNTPQRTATHHNTPQHTATHCNTPQHTATHRDAPQRTTTRCKDVRRVFKKKYTCINGHCNTLFAYVNAQTRLCSGLLVLFLFVMSRAVLNSNRMGNGTLIFTPTGLNAPRTLMEMTIKQRLLYEYQNVSMIHVHICICIYIYVHAYVYSYVYIHVYVCIYTCIYIYIYVYIYPCLDISIICMYIKSTNCSFENRVGFDFLTRVSNSCCVENLHTRICVCMCIRNGIHIFIDVPMYIFKHIYIYTSVYNSC